MIIRSLAVKMYFVMVKHDMVGWLVYLVFEKSVSIYET